MANFEDSDFSDKSDEEDEVFIRTVALSLVEDNALAAQAIGLVTTIFILDNQRESIQDFTVNPLLPKIERLNHLLSGHASIFKNMTGFTLFEWERLTQKVCPLLIEHARIHGQQKKKIGRPCKLSPEERLLSFVLYTKHNTGAQCQAIDWNYSRTSLNADGAFVASAINVALASEIQWPDTTRREALGKVLPDFPGCIGHVDGTLVKIRRPRIPEHKRFYNKRKAMYCMNNLVIVDHDGLFIYVDAGFPGSFHDARCLRKSHIFPNWLDYFRNDDLDRTQEYLLGDSGYLGLEEFILRRIDGHELPVSQHNQVMTTFNKRHSARRIKVEWGI